MSASPVILSKIFSRERPLFYYQLWHDSDADGIRDYLGEQLRYDFFMAPPRGTPGGVWYSSAEFDRLADLGAAKINSSKEFALSLVEQCERGWEPLKPYLEEGKRFEDAAEMHAYYKNLLTFWTPMNSPFFSLPDRDGIDPDFKDGILRIRHGKQEYTERMHEVFTEFFERRFPHLARLSYYLTPDETLALDAHEDPKRLAVYEERAQKGCFMLEGEVFPLDRLDAVLAGRGLALETFSDTGAASVKGQVACKGSARGTARVALSRKDIEKVQEGDILIAPMTTPDFLPAMKKAAAFVTDEGGLTCHAAIVAREMNKPCVIGTKIATRVFKDGDLIEVDATAGIVRKL